MATKKARPNYFPLPFVKVVIGSGIRDGKNSVINILDP
jgi:hypothetical protein